jgi:hypothetical protein
MVLTASREGILSEGNNGGNGNSHEARIAVLETEIRVISTNHRDIWDSLDKLRACILTSNTSIREKMDSLFGVVNHDIKAIDRDIKSILRWVATGVVGLLLSIVAFLFVKVMGW